MLKENLVKIAKKVLNNRNISYKEAIYLSEIKDKYLFDILFLSNKIREKFKGNKINLCSIINAKSGLCSEDCKFCAQSIKHKTKIQTYPLIDEKDIIKFALKSSKSGVHKFGIVTSGKRINNKDLIKICNAIKKIKKHIIPCVSFGELDENIASSLKKAGLIRYHHNLETSSNFFPKICTTHSYENKIKTIKLAKSYGFEICSGGIFGIGESFKDRIDMAFTLKELNVNSIPLNFLMPIKGTPFENYKILEPLEVLKIIAIFRFILPTRDIKIAGGRPNLNDMQAWIFYAGTNSIMVGNYLTCVGRSIEQDLQLLKNFNLKTK